MNIFLCIVSIIAALGGLFLLFDGSRKKNATLAITGGAIAVVFTVILSWDSFDISSGDTSYVSKVETFDQAAGDYAGKQLSGKKVMVILGDELPDSDEKVQARMYEAFKKSFGGEVIEHKLKRLNTYGVSREQASENIDHYVDTVNGFYAAADSEGCDVVVQFAILQIPVGDAAGLVEFPEKAKVLLMPNAIRLDAPAARRIAQDLFDQSLLFGIITEKQSFNYKEEVPEDAAAAFEKRYLLITPDNKDSFPEYLEYSTEE